MSGAGLKQFLGAGIACVALLATIATVGVWLVSSLSPIHLQIGRKQVTVNVDPFPPISNVLTATFLENRDGRIVLVHQAVEQPPPPEIDLAAYPHNSYGPAEVKVWQVDAGNIRRVRIKASHLQGDVAKSLPIVLAADDPVQQPATFPERVGFAFRRDGDSTSSLMVRTPQRLPRDLFGQPVPSARITQVMMPHWLLLVASCITLGWSCRSLWRSRRARHWARSGRCGACGYDLRSSPDRCPECGWRSAANMPSASA